MYSVRASITRTTADEKSNLAATMSLLVISLLSHGLVVKPVNVDGLTRRSACLSAAAAFAFGQSFAAFAADDNDDSFVGKLSSARNVLQAAKPALNDGNFDSVRLAVANTMPLLTYKGYRGQSLKTIAKDLEEKGEGRGKSLLTERQNLLVGLATVEKYCYKRQMGGGEDVGALTAADSALDDAVDALDNVLKLLR